MARRSIGSVLVVSLVAAVATASGGSVPGKAGASGAAPVLVERVVVEPRYGQSVSTVFHFEAATKYSVVFAGTFTATPKPAYANVLQRQECDWFYCVHADGTRTRIQFAETNQRSLFPWHLLGVSAYPQYSQGHLYRSPPHLLGLDPGRRLAFRFREHCGAASTLVYSCAGQLTLSVYEGEAPLSDSACTIEGTAGNDVLTGTSGPDVICGNFGNDRIRGLGGNDRLDGGPGSDRILGGDGADTLLGGGGSDELDGGPGNDRLDGCSGHDELQGGPGRDMLEGSAGRYDDRLEGGGDDDTLTSGSGNDTLSGDDGSDELSSGDGDDHLYGGRGNDRLTGGGGKDKLVGDIGLDSLSGGSGDDSLRADDRVRDSAVDGGPGEDTADIDRGLDPHTDVETICFTESDPFGTTERRCEQT